MFKTNAIDSVNNRYVDEDPAHGINGTRLIADDRNIVQDELTNAIERSGQTLDPSGDFTHNDQLATAMFINAVAAGAFVDNGSANTYQLTPLTGEDGLTMPGSYSQLAGATILFKPANANTGASTVEVGQTTSALLPAKALLDLTGNPLVGGELSTSNYYEIKYDPTADGGNGAWLVVNDGITNMRVKGALNLLDGQIAFPSTQNASSDANTLDDYEEGTWTPYFTGGSGGTTGDTAHVGHYVKIGNLVMIKGYIYVSSLHTISGNVYINGLPFVSASSAYSDSSVYFGYSFYLNITAGANLSGQITPATDKITCYSWDTTDGATFLNASELTDDTKIVFAGFYMT